MHDVASLMKLWLRALSFPLVPDEFYARCIEQARSSSFVAFVVVVGRRRRISEGAAPPPLQGESPTSVAALLAQLPARNRVVIAHVCNFLRDMSAPDNQAINKMSPSNLAVVFAPCLMRYPKGTDTLTAMSNTVRAAAMRARWR